MEDLKVMTCSSSRTKPTTGWSRTVRSFKKHEGVLVTAVLLQVLLSSTAFRSPKYVLCRDEIREARDARRVTGDGRRETRDERHTEREHLDCAPPEPKTNMSAHTKHSGSHVDLGSRARENT